MPGWSQKATDRRDRRPRFRRSCGFPRRRNGSRVGLDRRPAAGVSRRWRRRWRAARDRSDEITGAFGGRWSDSRASRAVSLRSAGRSVQPIMVFAWVGPCRTHHSVTALTPAAALSAPAAARPSPPPPDRPRRRGAVELPLRLAEAPRQRVVGHDALADLVADQHRRCRARAGRAAPRSGWLAPTQVAILQQMIGQPHGRAVQQNRLPRNQPLQRRPQVQRGLDGVPVLARIARWREILSRISSSRIRAVARYTRSKPLSTISFSAKSDLPEAAPPSTRVSEGKLGGDIL